MDYSLALPMLPPGHFLALAKAAEEAGFTSIAVPESVFFPEQVSADYPYTPDGGRFWAADTPFLDPFVAISAMAAVTERIKFFTNVLKLGIREPLLVAKTVSSAAAMADGRWAWGWACGSPRSSSGSTWTCAPGASAPTRPSRPSAWP